MIVLNDLKCFHLGRFPPMVHLLFDGKNNSVLDNSSTLSPPATSNPLVEIRKEVNFHLLAEVGEKTCAAVPTSRCGQVGKGTQVFAFRVIPGTEQG